MTHQSTLLSSISQQYVLANRARSKLLTCAAAGKKKDFDLRVLVGHANLLDRVMESIQSIDLDSDEREYHGVVSPEYAATGKDRSADAPTMLTTHELYDSDSDSDSCSDEDDDAYSSDSESDSDEEEYISDDESSDKKYEYVLDSSYRLSVSHKPAELNSRSVPRVTTTALAISEDDEDSDEGEYAYAREQDLAVLRPVWV
ncbi:LAFE_0G16886g1_1 [Lachancea fermentati]|uniref:LAFE_0G16886g1_1 n=1 Tax=Lachancea fermentati TaxID=4955 RepID=A0A1G4MIJ1_LACFM|nr:LAFE_0G16886g1_1 [Lachancea fermentati]